MGLFVPRTPYPAQTEFHAYPPCPSRDLPSGVCARLIDLVPADPLAVARIRKERAGPGPVGPEPATARSMQAAVWRLRIAPQRGARHASGAQALVEVRLHARALADDGFDGTESDEAFVASERSALPK